MAKAKSTVEGDSRTFYVVRGSYDWEVWDKRPLLGSERIDCGGCGRSYFKSVKPVGVVEIDVCEPYADEYFGVNEVQPNQAREITVTVGPIVNLKAKPKRTTKRTTKHPVKKRI